MRDPSTLSPSEAEGLKKTFNDRHPLMLTIANHLEAGTTPPYLSKEQLLALGPGNCRDKLADLVDNEAVQSFVDECIERAVVKGLESQGMDRLKEVLAYLNQRERIGVANLDRLTRVGFKL